MNLDITATFVAERQQTLRREAAASRFIRRQRATRADAERSASAVAPGQAG
jgi:hypothetical protein